MTWSDALWMPMVVTGLFTAAWMLSPAALAKPDHAIAAAVIIAWTLGWATVLIPVPPARMASLLFRSLTITALAPFALVFAVGAFGCHMNRDPAAARLSTAIAVSGAISLAALLT